MEPRITCITLGVKDLPRSRKFYESGFGWKASASSNEHVAFFQTGAMVFALYAKDSLANDAGISASGEGFSGIALAYNVREKNEVAEVLNHAEKFGATITKPAHDVFWGGHCGYFKDPDGYLWEIAWNPGWQLAEDGGVRLKN